MTSDPSTEPLTADERQALRTLRLERDWSYREMAERVGLPEPTLRNVLEGHGEPLERTLFKLRRWMSTEPLASSEARS